jgi:hypothetical protein
MPLQVTIAPDLALGAGGRLTRALIPRVGVGNAACQSHSACEACWYVTVTMRSSLSLYVGARPRGAKQMRVAVRWLARYVALLGVLALPGTGCSQERNNSTMDATTTSSSTATAGPATFVAQARAMPFGTKDLAAASDKDLLRLGRVVCDGLGIQGLRFHRVVQRLVESEACPTTTEATALVRSAVRNLCPEHASAIPATVKPRASISGLMRPTDRVPSRGWPQGQWQPATGTGSDHPIALTG